ncbi:Low-density lipoprotein receptor-related protein 1 [Chionoecetes opilio]|uniref:Low-density lipoprotein receptor-related protein 1 n=1 Tax=Chionoecetes opilio TaxID=41210 RepID=A0A8J4Y5Z7_CHIOP|nr:Low-density lipoprotein receptor-related protein 1 [Chionoecetes opilio]
MFNFKGQSGTCPPGLFLCDADRCLPISWRCDWELDCSDMTDELSCNQFTCADSNCVPRTWQCDGHKDCPDGSDEPPDCETKECKEEEFKCKTTGRCIPKQWVCDGDDDCGSGDDENPPVGCPEPPPLVCSVGHFSCPVYDRFDRRCLLESYYCDGHKDCWDGSDEPDSCLPRTCLESQFTCGDSVGKCVPDVWVCNGRPDCDDASDEANCSEYTFCLPLPSFLDTFPLIPSLTPSRPDLSFAI